MQQITLVTVWTMKQVGHVDINLNEQIFGFDIDQTLVSSRRTHKLPGDIAVENPYTQQIVYVKPHIGHVDLLKEMHGRRRFIVVHSAAGVKWALAVVKALKLEKFVDRVETKMLGYIDDTPVEKWLNNRIFLSDGERS